MTYFNMLIKVILTVIDRVIVDDALTYGSELVALEVIGLLWLDSRGKQRQERNLLRGLLLVLGLIL
jgi:hypothetical protein